ncbi:hypothetical protein B7463_g5280, partial [Scytalidium lignicola]
MVDQGRLSDKVVIVTGGGQGFGEGIVAKCVAEGAKVLLLDINESNAAKVASQHPHGSAIPMLADVSCEEDWQKALDLVLSTFGKLDVVINNAGVNNFAQSSIELPESEFDRLFRINVKQLFFSTRTIIPYFKKQGKGLFVNISSVSATRPREGLVWYGASKAAVSNATRGLAAEWAKDNIRFNAICPVAGDTGMVENYLGKPDTPENRKGVLAGIPLGRLCQPFDIANMAAYLASDEAEFMTGSIIDVDGGRTI